ncbi:SLAC1 anion channel family protein [Phaeobacter sp. QD34_3]|uniref:SLAC1 anion channel family protein n=1 Tax=unclassified Phaeobacter TaxID=2621772 RepID=UPI00237FBD6C|nr:MULTISPECIES: SLAC1 anion channel family protein [unclassified Phaeobacter]MDE4134869.1 SLAC1 anion channel family protein [Phaeobacter sp. QD34_3]MDE4138499.1 SLAC1 anion channel family protein [Phaeobacter sp. QD34_24]
MSTEPQTPQQAEDPRLAHFPVPFFASVMGLSGVTLALHTAGFDGISLVVLGLAVVAFAVLAFVYTLKALRHPAAVAAEWQHPVKLAFFPAMSISLLLIATALRPVLPELARIVWLVGALAQGALTLAVLSNWIGHRSFQTIHMSPAWFIPAVGNVVAPVAGVALGFVETSWLFFSAGMIFWLVLLVLVMNRLMFHDPLPGRMVPTLAILIAPPAVGFLAWLQLNGGVLDGFARFLFGAALVFFALAATQVAKLRGLPFALSWWALSFPMAALTIASFRFGALSGSAGHEVGGYVLLALLCAIVAGLVWRTGLAIARGEICQPE